MSESLKQKIDRRLNELNQSAKRSLGQNFLIDANIVDKITSYVNENEMKSWVEIGPGLGSLTDDLKANLVALVELDTNFAKFWRNNGYKVIESDALKINWNQFENIKPWGLVSNLPYQISSRIVIEMSINGSPSEMVLMFQKEVADRILCPGKSSNYGFLSVVAQTFWKIRKLVFVSPNCFSPRPKVDSQVLTFAQTENINFERDKFVSFVKSCFLEKRKKISNKARRLGLLAEFKQFFDLNQLSLDMRAEELTPYNYQELFLFCRNKGSLK